MDPKSSLRVGSAAGAYALFRAAAEATAPLFDTLATVEGFVGGGDPEEECEEGKGSASNVNFQIADGLCRDLESTFWNRAFNEPTLATIRPHVTDDAVSLLSIGDAASQRFTDLLKSLPFFHGNKRAALADFIRVGRAYRFFPDEVELRDEVLNFSDVLLPKNASTDPTTWVTFFIRRSETVSRLYSLVRDADAEKTSEENGYNIREIKRLLFDKCAVYERDEDAKAKPALLADFSEDHPLFQTFWEQMEGNSLNQEFTDTEVIPTVLHYVKEFDGTWSVRSFATAAGEKGLQYYREYVGEIESVYNVLIPFFYLQPKRAAATQSFVHKAFNPLKVGNEILNSIVDFLPWLTSLIVDKGDSDGEPKSVTIQSKGALITVDGGSINAAAMQAVRSEGALSVYKMLSAVVENQRKFAPSNMGSNLGSVQPVSSAEMQGLQGAVSDAQIASISVHDEQEVHYYREILRRVLTYPADGQNIAEVRRFKEALAADGVELSDLRSALVTVTPSIGYGNTVARLAALREVIEGAETLGVDPYGKERLSRLFISSRLGPDAARDILPPTGRVRSTVSEREAYKENLFLSMGQVIPVLVEDDHTQHFVVHFREIVAPVAQAIQADQRIDIPQAHRAIGATLAHLQAHGPRVRGKGAKEAAQALAQTEQLFAVLSRLLEQQQAQAQEQMQAQANAQARELDVKAQLEKYRIDLDTQVKAMDAENQNRIREMKAQTKMEIDRLESSNRMALEALR